MLKRFLTGIFVFMFVIMGFAAYASQAPVGIIISMYSGAWVQHVGGAKERLTLKAPVYEGDVISTDKTGKAQILFNDDTTLAVAPSSTVSIDEYAFSGSDRPSFSVKLVRGASRVISGKIVEQNPMGFKLSAPHGTAGIRGTIVSARAGANEDIFSLDSIDPRHSVSVYSNSNQNNIASSSQEGQSFIVGGNPDLPVNIRPTSAEDRRFFNDVFSFNPVSANNETGAGNRVGNGEGLVTENFDEDDSRKIVDNMGNTTRPNDTAQNATDQRDILPILPKSFNAFYSGKLDTSVSSFSENFKGDFGFKVNLITGQYYDGFMQGQVKGGGVFNAAKGKGVVSPDGKFAVSDFIVSGTGIYEGFNSALMSGTITDQAATIDWSLKGFDSIIGGTGQGFITDAIKYVPLEDKKASFAGSYISPSMVPSAESGFGFNLMLVSGGISNAYIYYMDSLGAFKAENGYGKADARNKDYLGSFRIDWNSADVKGYGNKDSINARSDVTLIGEIINNDSAVSITRGGTSGFEITGGTGNLVESLPGIDSEKTIRYSAFWKSGDITSENLADSENYYKFGFKINYITGDVSDVYAYGGQFHEPSVAGSGLYSNDNSPFFINDGSGKFVDKDLNLKFTTMQYGGNYNHQGFSLVGSLPGGDAGFTGGLQYDGVGGLFNSFGLGNPTVTGIKPTDLSGIPWEPLPFMVGYFEGAGNKGKQTFKTGFKANLVTGKLSLGYLSIDTFGANFRAVNGNGRINNEGEFELNWASSDMIAKDAFPGVDKAKLEGEFSSDYKVAEADIEVLNASGGSLFSADINLKYGNTFNGAIGSYSATIAPSASGSSLVHNGGQLGITIDLKNGVVSDGGFKLDFPGVDGVLYAYAGRGTINGNRLDVAWNDKTIFDENGNNNTYKAAKLVGDITAANNKLTLTNRSNVAFVVSNTISFDEPDYTQEKKGTVSGNITGGGTYGFTANLYSGTINDASIRVTGSGSLSASNGSGYIKDGRFNIDNYNITDSGGHLNGFDKVKMGGSNSGKDFTDIVWQATKGGSSVVSGTGTNGSIR